MGIRLDDQARRFVAALAERTAVTATDCIVDDRTVTFVVPPDDMGDVIGPGGSTVDDLEERFDRRVVLVADADRSDAFVANALAPAAVYDVAVENGEAVAYVDPEDVGVAIGTDGERVDRARRLADRHFDLDGITIQERSPNDDT